MKDRDVIFHEKWLGLAQPVEGLVFSVPALADAQIAPDLRAELSVRFEEQLDVASDDAETRPPRIRSLEALFRGFLGYDEPGMCVPRAELAPEISFYAAEGGQELRPSFALGRGPFAEADPLAMFDEAPESPGPTSAPPPMHPPKPAEQYWALVWDLTETALDIDLDASESETGPWRYPPTSKLIRLLRHTGIAVGFLFNGRHLRLVYAPVDEPPSHLTFRVEHMARPDGRPILAAMELLLHARRSYGAAPEFTLEGLLRESRRRQADVTAALAKQVFEAVEMLVAGIEAAAVRDIGPTTSDWLRPALEEEGDHFYQGVLSVILRLVFLLYSEDQGLLPVEHRFYAEHLSLFGLYERLSQDVGAHPESMHHRFGAYGQLLSLFRGVYYGVKHRDFVLPPRKGRLFDPNAYPFLEGGLPNWTAAVSNAAARAAVEPPSIDDGTIYHVLHRLVVFEGQRLSYRSLDVEQIGSVYESLMGYHVQRMGSSAVRVGDLGVWVESHAIRGMPSSERARFFKDVCRLSSAAASKLEKELKAAQNEGDVVEALLAQAPGRKGDKAQHRAELGRLVLQPGDERRRTASHYTPPSLTEKVVRKTLEPLLACLGENRTAEQILQLKICDPAMGSGAFLVAACRELSREIEAAWRREGVITAIIEEHGDAFLHARRLVTQQCLYGVDKNPAAVELAKLSLWLVTLSKKLPFTFVDHALRHGDSLVGLDFKQIEAFHWNPPGQVETCRVLLKDALEQAIDLRQQIVALATQEDPSAQAEKRRLFDFSQQAIDRVRLVADVCVGSFFAETKDAARERERKRRLHLVETWLSNETLSQDDTKDEEKRKEAEKASREAHDELEALAAEIRKSVSPFHWWIEFPEVFFQERPDPLQGGEVNGAALMEAVVGNPPFGGKNNIIEANPDAYLDWLKVVSPGAHGNSDLSAHFFRRASALLGRHGTLGLIATNTIAQGDTRTTGLAALVGQGWQLYDATDSFPWPGAAAVTVSIVHGAHGLAAQNTELRLDGRPVHALNSRLSPKPERSDPVALELNAGAAYVGSYVLGMGFVLTPEERDALIRKDPKNGERIFPYLGGEEVNSSPTQSFDRYVISFGQMSFDEAERWPDLIKILSEKVKPEREANNREVRRKYWWRFGETTPALYAAIASLSRCLVTSCVSKHLLFSFQPTTRIFSHRLVVFPLTSYSSCAVLQARIHGAWAWLLSSTMKTDLNYSLTDCLATFPFPQPDPRAMIPSLESIGETLYDTRAKFMVDTQQGLTKTYNALKDPTNTDPRILELRRLHEEMDRAVLAAYGWQDIPVPPYCPLSDADRQQLQAFEDEVIDRLYLLNAKRAEEEAKMGLSGKKGKKTAATASKSKSTPAADEAEPRQRKMF